MMFVYDGMGVIELLRRLVERMEGRSEFLPASGSSPIGTNQLSRRPFGRFHCDKHIEHMLVERIGNLFSHVGPHSSEQIEADDCVFQRRNCLLIHLHDQQGFSIGGLLDSEAAVAALGCLWHSGRIIQNLASGRCDICHCSPLLLVTAVIAGYMELHSCVSRVVIFRRIRALS